MRAAAELCNVVTFDGGHGNFAYHIIFVDAVAERPKGDVCLYDMLQTSLWLIFFISVIKFQARLRISQGAPSTNMKHYRRCTLCVTWKRLCHVVIGFGKYTCVLCLKKGVECSWTFHPASAKKEHGRQRNVYNQKEKKVASRVYLFPVQKRGTPLQILSHVCL